jgi:bifunctional DNA-binding transcriptional regulator/antitoxin component of YhaV-PrlF toxin-antitoxin module
MFDGTECAAYTERWQNINMTVAAKNKPVVVPSSVLRRAGFKRGQELEVEACSGVVTIMPKLMSDELQDERDVHDPKIRAVIRKGHEEFLAGKTRPVAEFLAERAARARKHSRRLPGA